ncbi:MAG: ScpA family protein [Patescibacteria group bacterium]
MPFAVQHEKFSGPLDFLLQEIEKEKLSINEIAIARITDGFLNYIKSIPSHAHHEIAEFLVIASQLLLIKSRSLLPSLEITQEEQISIEELENRLKALQKIREVAEELRGLFGVKNILYERESLVGRKIIFYPPPQLTVYDLAEAFQEILAAIPKPRELPTDEIKKIISLEEKIVELQKRIANHAIRLFSDMVKGTTDKAEIIVSFLAILELARKRIIDIDQDARFGDISIKKSTDESHT